MKQVQKTSILAVTVLAVKIWLLIFPSSLLLYIQCCVKKCRLYFASARAHPRSPLPFQVPTTPRSAPSRARCARCRRTPRCRARCPRGPQGRAVQPDHDPGVPQRHSLKHLELRSLAPEQSDHYPGFPKDKTEHSLKQDKANHSLKQLEFFREYSHHYPKLRERAARYNVPQPP